MKTLYESILNAAKSDETAILHDEVKNLVNKLGEDTQDDSHEKYKFFSSIRINNERH